MDTTTIGSFQNQPDTDVFCCSSFLIEEKTWDVNLQDVSHQYRDCTMREASKTDWHSDICSIMMQTQASAGSPKASTCHNKLCTCTRVIDLCACVFLSF